jgi:DNA-binding SARP family transcriptional activator
VEFRILGPLEVRTGEGPVAVPGAKPRAVLAVLLLNANRSVGADQVAHALWGEEAPAGAAKTVQVHVSRLRKALADPGLIATTPAGYELRVDPDRVDAHRFERLLAEGRSELAAGRPREAAAVLGSALSEWRGDPLADLAYEPFAQAEIARLDELRLAALEQLVEARLALGAHAEVVGELEALVTRYPYREGLWALLMLALYRSDRQADALQAYQDARGRLVEELGIDPGERLRALERAVLEQDPALAAPAPASPQPAPAPEAPAPAGRRLVSIVFADISGSTAMAERLDPEAVHAVLDGFMETCSAVIEQHGGAVEGFAGDSVVGVFGQAVAHEDHALRAVRAAVGVRDAGAALDLGLKVGVDAGEVFVGAGRRRARFAAGDAFNVAARLEQSAQAGEILLGDQLWRLVRGAVRAERLPPLALKGKANGVQAWRLLDLVPDGEAIPRSPATPFVGREREIERLVEAFRRVADQPACEAVTVLGPAGIGKSRLAREFVRRVEDEATVAVGRCPSYGEEVAYRPLAEVIGTLSAGDPERWVFEVLDEPSARLVLSAIGLAEERAHAEETFWAVRRALERVSAGRPLLILFDDLHWAQARLLDLIEHLVAFLRGRPVLLVCLARPELLEARAGWVHPEPGRSLLVLDPLSDAEAEQVVRGTGELAPEVAARVVRTAEGNPLFLEHLAAVGAETAGTPLPSSIQAVLAARIDRLEPAERALLEEASVQGRNFDVSALGDPVRADGVVSLVHKGLVRPERSEEVFRFAHVLLREVAYGNLPKARRAELHEHVAGWLQSRGEGGDEPLAHHLAAAAEYRAELGAPDPALAKTAGRRLAAAADAALLRGDGEHAAGLLERARALLDDDELLPALGAALFEAGRTADAARVLDEALERASDERVRARARIERELVRAEVEPAAAAMAEAALAVLVAAGDAYGQSRGWLLRGQIDWNAGRVAAADAAWERAARLAQQAGHRPDLFEIIGWRALAAALGPTAVDEAIERCEAFRSTVAESPVAVASTLNPMALLHAMRGEFEVADALLEQAGEILHELGGMSGAVSHLEASVQLLAGRPDLAEARLRQDAQILSTMGAGGSLATTNALLAQALVAQNRPAEAAELCGEREGGEDIVTRAIRCGVQARVLALQSRCDEAEALAREVIEIVEETDLLSHRADAKLDLADVLRTCDRPAADDAVRGAIALYERKGNTAAARRAAERLTDPRGK